MTELGASSALVDAVRRSDEAAVEAALGDGASADAKTADGHPVLMLAAREGDLATVKRLLDAGARPGAQAPPWLPDDSTILGARTYLHADSPRSEGDQWRSVPLHTQRRAWVLEDGMLHGLYPDLRDRPQVSLPTALAVAAYEGHIDVVEVLLGRGGANRLRVTQALAAAARRGRTDVCARLLRQRHDAITPDECPLVEAAVGGHSEVIAMLLDAGHDIDEMSSDEMTALYSASVSGHVDVVRLLLERGACLHPGSTEHPLAGAANEGHRQVFEVLQAWTEDAELVRHYASDLERELRRRAHRRAMAGSAATCELVRAIWDFDRPRFEAALAEPAVDVDGLDLHGTRPLLAAAQTCSLRMVDALLRAGANPNVTAPEDLQGWRDAKTPLMLVIDAGTPSIEIREPIIVRLVEAGAALEQRDADGHRAIDYCWHYRDEPGFGGDAALLLRLGAKPPPG